VCVCVCVCVCVSVCVYVWVCECVCVCVCVHNQKACGSSIYTWHISARMQMCVIARAYTWHTSALIQICVITRSFSFFLLLFSTKRNLATFLLCEVLRLESCVTWLVQMPRYICNTLQHTVTHCNTLRQAVPCCNTHTYNFVHVCDMTRPCVAHVAFLCVARLIHMCGVLTSERESLTNECKSLTNECKSLTHKCKTHVWHMCDTCLISVCNTTYLFVWCAHEWVWVAHKWV